MAAESNFNQKVRKIMEISYHVQMDRLRECLGIDLNTFNNKIIEWAQNFGFSINGNYISISGEIADAFMQELEIQANDWLNSSTKSTKSTEILGIIRAASSISLLKAGTGGKSRLSARGVAREGQREGGAKSKDLIGI